MANMTNLYDSSKCTACRGCQVACKNWNQLPASIEEFKGNYQTHESTDGDTYTIVKMTEYEHPVDGIQWKFAKFQCMHCVDPECMKACPRGAYSKTATGATNHDPNKCIGCQYCTYVCPFEVPKYRKREDKITKCTLCADRTAAGLKPACVTTCAPGALEYGEREEMLAKATERVKYLQMNGFPNATIYGRTELGGLNKIYILTDSPDKFGLPVNPQPYGQVSFWQNWVQPYFGWLIPLALAGSAVSFVTTRMLANKHTAHDEHHGEGVSE